MLNWVSNLQSNCNANSCCRRRVRENHWYNFWFVDNVTREPIRNVEMLNYSYRERTSGTQLNLTQYCFRQSIIECITLLNNFRGLKRSTFMRDNASRQNQAFHIQTSTFDFGSRWCRFRFWRHDRCRLPIYRSCFGETANCWVVNEFKMVLQRQRKATWITGQPLMASEKWPCKHL